MQIVISSGHNYSMQGLTLNRRSYAIYSQGNDMDIKLHFKGIISSKFGLEAAA
jgi:hypothetical protein